jgi:hypothetical protein
MSQVIDLCEGGSAGDNNNGEWPNKNAVSVPSLPRPRKRLRDTEEYWNGPVQKSATGCWAEFVVDLDLAAEEVEISVSPHKKRRGLKKGERSAMNEAAGKCAQIRKVVDATEKAVGCEDVQVADHRESHKGVAAAAVAAASHPMDSDSEQTNRNDRSADKRSQKVPTSKPPSKASLSEVWAPAWEDRLSELADYRKTHGHCNVPRRDIVNSKLSNWVHTQRSNYWLLLDGKPSQMTLPRIQALESLGIEWRIVGVTTWEDSFCELADYLKSHGHCNVHRKDSEHSKLAGWVKTQRTQYRLHLEGKTSRMTAFRIQELDSLGFEWDRSGSAWKDRVSELADYRKSHGHCNVPRYYSENTKLGRWVGSQRKRYRLHLNGKPSQMAASRIRELESLGFEWDCSSFSWEVRLSELADYRKAHGHCNVPRRDIENSKLSNWIQTQRRNYWSQLDGKPSQMPTSRIQELESLGFEWISSVSQGKGKVQKANIPSLNEDATRVRKTSANSRHGANPQRETAPPNEILRTTGYH